ncbi:MAG: FAD-dependent oxidoreductase [Marmoricola sp.]
MKTPIEVCIIGAGITGLNALVVATEYLSPGDKVVLVDSRRRSGGMWVDTYDYVRLHQPHPIFTAGNIPWTLDRPADYLATKSEVLTHLEHCLDVAKSRVQVDERFGWSYESHKDGGDHVRVTLRSPDGRTEEIVTKRLIKALGHRVTPNDPLVTSSRQVRSITPESLDLAAVGASAEPIWVIGSGKTAMDTAHALITALPRREINLVAGSGTYFSRRESFFPKGAKRWWSGTPINSMLRELGRRFDGENEVEVRHWFRSTYGTGPLEEATDSFSAYLSDAECAVIRSGLHHVEPGYFADVVDTADCPQLVFRSGEARSIEPGTWIVNCTGSLLRTAHPYEPFVSAGGRVLSIQMRSSVTGPFTSFAGYYLTHLMFRDKLESAGLYELDVEDLHTKATDAVLFASVSVTMLNLGKISKLLPPKVITGCGLDFDRWYPLPRRLAGVVGFLRTQKSDGAHHRQTLATIKRRYDVRCGPLEAASLTNR